MSKSKKLFLVLAFAFVAMFGFAMTGISVQNAKQAKAEESAAATEIDITRTLNVTDLTGVNGAITDGKTFQFSLSEGNFKYAGGSQYWNDNIDNKKAANNNVDITEYIYINGKSVREIINANVSATAPYAGSAFPMSAGAVYNPVLVYSNDNGIEIKVLNSYISDNGGKYEIIFKSDFKYVNSDGNMLKLTEDVKFYEEIDIMDKIVADYWLKDDYKWMHVTCPNMLLNFINTSGNAWNDNYTTFTQQNGGVDIREYILVNGKTVKEITEANRDGTTSYTGTSFPLNLGGVYAPIVLFTPNDTTTNRLQLSIMNSYISDNGGKCVVTFKKGFRLINTGNQILKITKDIVFEMKDEAWNKTVCGEEKTETTISGIQVRSGGEARRNYLVLLSESYTGAANAENIYTSLATLDKIKIYTSSEATPVALSDIFNGHIDQTVWTQPGLFLNITDYDTYNGSTIYKIVIEKGCEFPIIGDVTEILVADKDYTYRNLEYGSGNARNGAFKWGIESTLTLKNEDETVGTMTVVNGMSIEKLPEIPAKDGFLTLGWYIDVTKIQSGDTWNYTESKTAYAKYAEEIDITEKWTVKDYTSSENTFKTFQFSLNDSTVNFKYTGGNYFWNDNGENQKSTNNGVDITDYIYINDKSVKQLITENAAKDADKQYGGIIGTNAGIYAPVTVYNWDNNIEVKISNKYIENEITGDWSIIFKNGFKLVNTDKAVLSVKSDVVAYKWVKPTETEAEISGVQVRAVKFSDGENAGKVDPRRAYLVILSDNYKGTAVGDNVDTSFATLDKIKIYTAKDGAPVALSTIFNGYVDQSIWTQPGLFLNIQNYDTYNGKTIYKVVIEEGCKLPIYNGKITNLLVADKEYVFYNKGYDTDASMYEAFSWGTTETPSEARNLGNIGIVTVTNQAEEKPAEGAERGRWIIIRMTENFPVYSSADDYLTYNLTNILDNILVYSATKGENGEITDLGIKALREYFKGGITLRQFGSPGDIGFGINDSEEINGTHIYAIKILKGCEIPYLTEGGEYCKKTIAEDVLFINDDWGFSGEIGGTDEGGVIRHYENWAVNWNKGCEVKFTVSGIDGVSFETVIIKSTDSIDLAKYARDGYEVSASDDKGYTYYDKIVYTGSSTVNVTLTYTEKTEDPTDSIDSTTDPTDSADSTDPTDSSVAGGCFGSVGGVFEMQMCFVAVIAIAVIIRRKRSLK